MKASIKAKVKAVTKKAKTAAKAVAKKAKAKCKSGKCCAALALLAVLCGCAAICGCAAPGNTQPAKSATMSNTFEDCIIVVAQKTCVSNRVVTAESTADAPAITMFQVAQNLENAGTDSTTQTTTQTPTVDVKPDVNVDVPVTKGSAANAAADLIGAAASALKGTGTASGNCSGGNCSTGACTDGSCEYTP